MKYRLVRGWYTKGKAHIQTKDDPFKCLCGGRWSYRPNKTWESAEDTWKRISKLLWKRVCKSCRYRLKEVLNKC